MSEQPQTGSGSGPALTLRQIRDVAGLLCLLAAVVIVNVVAWAHDGATGLLAVAGDLVLLGYLLGSDR